MEGVSKNPVAKNLALAGLALAAVGGLYYAFSQFNYLYGLYLAAAGGVLVLLAALVGRNQLLTLLKTRRARLGLGSGAAVVAALAVAVFLGALANRHNVQWDFSQGGQFTLAPQTTGLLTKLKEPVTAYAFFREGQQGRAQAKDLLEMARLVNKKFDFKLVDPDQEPMLAKRFNVNTYGTVVLVSGKDEERANPLDEQNLTNALFRLQKKDKRTVYFLAGHGELGLDDIGKHGISELSKSLKDQGYQVESLLLATSQQVPPDAVTVVLAGPKKPYLEPEKERLAAYLGRGGGVLLLLDPESDAGLMDWLKERGIELGTGLVIDQQSTLAGLSPLAPTSVQYGFHDITNSMDNLFSFFPLARPVSVAKNLPPGVSGEDLVRTSPNSWNIIDMKRLGKEEFRLDPAKDKKGPFSLAAVVSLPGKKAEAKAEDAKGKDGKAADQPPAGEPKEVKGNLAVFGDSDFVSNQFLRLQGNADLVMNAVGFLSKDEDMITIRPKRRANQPLLLQANQAQMVFWLPVVVLPGLFLIIGVVVFIRRRRPA